MYKAQWFIDLQIFSSYNASEVTQTLQVSLIVETAMFASEEIFASFSLVSTDIMRLYKKPEKIFDLLSPFWVLAKAGGYNRMKT